MSSIATRRLSRSDKASEPDMSIAIQARAHIGALVQFLAPSLPLKSGLPKVAAFVGINARRARALWNSQARSILAEEIAALEAARARIAERIITKEISDHANRLEVHASRLASIDPHAHREEVARLRKLAARARAFFDCSGEA